MDPQYLQHCDSTLRKLRPNYFTPGVAPRPENVIQAYHQFLREYYNCYSQALAYAPNEEDLRHCRDKVTQMQVHWLVFENSLVCLSFHLSSDLIDLI